MQNLYCISGLGADENVFKYLDLSFAKPVFIHWIEPLQNESLADYAVRLKQTFIAEKNPFILGLSLGGMLATEITKLIPGAKTVIISSAKTSNEIPFLIKLLKHAPLYKILPVTKIRKTSAINIYFLGANTTVSKAYLQSVGKHINIKFYRWAVGAIVNWNNKTIPLGITHIHGTGDRLLPYKFVQPDITIKNGGHLMIVDNAAEISMLLKEIFS